MLDQCFDHDARFDCSHCSSIQADVAYLEQRGVRVRYDVWRHSDNHFWRRATVPPRAITRATAKKSVRCRRSARPLAHSCA